MFRKEELWRLYEMSNENETINSKKEERWIKDFEGWSDHVLRNVKLTKEQTVRFKKALKKMISVPPPTYNQTYQNNEGKGINIKMDPKNYKKYPAYKMSPEKVEAAKPVVEEWLKVGYVKKVNYHWANCIMNFVVDMREKTRVCLDFSKFNRFLLNEFESLL